MKKITPLLFLLFFFGKNGIAQNEAPIISNLIANTDFSNNTITLTYDLEDLENDDYSLSPPSAIFLLTPSGDFAATIAFGESDQIARAKLLRLINLTNKLNPKYSIQFVSILFKDNKLLIKNSYTPVLVKPLRHIIIIK